MPLKEAWGSDAGSDPTEEDRKEGKVEESKQGRVVSEKECKEALEEFLNPSVTSHRIEQSIRTGFLERPETSPNHVVILAEKIPSWLAAADSWGAQQLSLYCEKEMNWYRPNLDLVTPLISFHTVAGLARGSWLEEENKIILIQGSSSFCSKMITGLTSLGVTTEDKIIVTCNEKFRNLKLCFKFHRLSHSRLGGSTDTITSVGFSKGCVLPTTVEFTKGVQTTIRDHICPAEKGSTIEPSSKEALPSTGLASLSQVATEEFIVPSLFSSTHWVKRLLSNAEILSILDSPVQVTKAVNSDHHMIGLSDDDSALVQLITPLKTIQEATRMLFGFRIHEEERHIIPIYDTTRLAPLIPGLQDIYTEIDQAKVAKNDDSEADTSLWDHQALRAPEDYFDSDIELLLVNNGHKKIQEEKLLLDAFRKFHSRRYVKKVKQSYGRYMKTKYGVSVFGDDFYEDIDKVFTKIEKQGLTSEGRSDLYEGKKAISKAASSSFWDWDKGSFPYFWRWQPEIKNDLSDGTPLWFHPDLLPKNTSKRQRLPKDGGILRQMVDKLVKVRDRGYIGKLLLGSITLSERVLCYIK